MKTKNYVITFIHSLWFFKNKTKTYLKANKEYFATDYCLYVTVRKRWFVIHQPISTDLG